MQKYLVWVMQSNMTFEQIKKAGLFIEADGYGDALLKFATACRISTRDVQAMGPDEVANAEAREERRKTKVQTEAVLAKNANGELHPDQLDLKYTACSHERTIREWIVACIEAEQKLAKLKEQL